MAKKKRKSGSPPKRKPEPLDPLRAPWDQQPAETHKAFAGFEVYRVLGGATRTLRQAAEQAGKSNALFEQWSQRWRWVERGKAWDQHLSDQSRQAEIEAVRDLREREINFGQAMQAVGGAKLQELSNSIESLKPGEKIELTAAEAKGLVDVGLKLERRGRGEPDAVIQHNHDHIDVTKMSDEQLERIEKGESPEKVWLEVMH